MQPNSALLWFCRKSFFHTTCGFTQLKHKAGDNLTAKNQ